MQSRVYMRTRCAYMCVRTYVRARARANAVAVLFEPPSGTVALLNRAQVERSAIEIRGRANARNCGGWGSPVFSSTMSRLGQVDSILAFAPVLTGSEPGRRVCYGTRNELLGSPRASYARKESCNNIPLSWSFSLSLSLCSPFAGALSVAKFLNIYRLHATEITLTSVSVIVTWFYRCSFPTPISYYVEWIDWTVSLDTR